MPKQLLKTPRGMLQWAQILEPTKSLDDSKPDLWKVDLVTPWNQVAYELTQVLEAIYTQTYGPNATPAEHAWPYKMETMDGKDTGNVVFTFKRNTINSNGRPVGRPIVVDAARNPWPRGLLIGNGSEGIVAFSPYAWRNNLNRCGISLYLEAVQVLSHVPYESLDAEAVFDEVPGGFVAPRKEEVFGQGEASDPAATSAPPSAPPSPMRPPGAPAPSRAPAAPAQGRPAGRPPARPQQSQPWVGRSSDIEPDFSEEEEEVSF